MNNDTRMSTICVNDVQFDCTISAKSFSIIILFIFEIKTNRAKEYHDMGEDFHH